MLRKFSNSRSFSDNIKLGSLTAFSAGMVNVASVTIFYAFTSNVTGHYAILAEEIAKAHWYQVGVVLSWITLFYLGNFTSNIIIINLNQKHAYFAHALPILLEISCLLSVGIYGEYKYSETLIETELMVCLMLYAMGLQNGLTASISNFAIKTTHLTGLTTDLGILSSMMTKKEYRENKELREKVLLLIAIVVSYLLGAVFSGILFLHIGFKVFYIVCIFLLIVILYDYSNLKISKIRMRLKKSRE